MAKKTLLCKKCGEIMEGKGELTVPYEVGGDAMEDDFTFFQCPKCKNIRITDMGFRYDNPMEPKY